MAARVVVDVEPRRRDRPGRRPAARRLADPQPVLVAMAALLQRLPWLLFGLWAGAIADRVDRRLLVVVADLAAGPGRGGAVRHHRHRPGRRHRGAGHHLPVRGRRGVRRQRERHAAADAGAARGPGRRQRPAAGGVPHDEPAGRAAGGCVPLRAWARSGRSRCRCSAWRSGRCSSRGSRPRPGRRATSRARTCAATSPTGCAGSGATRRCARSRWSSSRSTSPGARRGRCWCSGRRTCSGWARSATGC